MKAIVAKLSSSPPPTPSPTPLTPVTHPDFTPPSSARSRSRQRSNSVDRGSAHTATTVGTRGPSRSPTSKRSTFEAFSSPPSTTPQPKPNDVNAVAAKKRLSPKLSATDALSPPSPLLPLQLTPVYLNIYDLVPYNTYVHPFGLGAYHSGIVILGREYAYGHHNGDWTGVFDHSPTQIDCVHFRESRLIGYVRTNHVHVQTIMNKLRALFIGQDYHILKKNCNHFTRAVCQELKLTYPDYLNRLSTFARLISCCLPSWMVNEGVAPRLNDEYVDDYDEEETLLIAAHDGLIISTAADAHPPMRPPYPPPHQHRHLHHYHPYMDSQDMSGVFDTGELDEEQFECDMSMDESKVSDEHIRTVHQPMMRHVTQTVNTVHSQQMNGRRTIPPPQPPHNVTATSTTQMSVTGGAALPNPPPHHHQYSNGNKSGHQSHKHAAAVEQDKPVIAQRRLNF